MKNLFKERHASVGYRFVGYILLCSSIVTLIITAIQVYFDYRVGLSLVEEQMHQIEKSYLQSLANGLWVSNETIILLQLEGIKRLPDMQYLEVLEDGKIVASVGTPKQKNTITHKLPIRHMYNGQDLLLGEVTIVASLEGVYSRLRNKVFVILATQAVKTFIVCFCIIFIFYYLVGGHLASLARFAKSQSLGTLDKPFSLKRVNREHQEKDELDHLVLAFNEMNLRIFRDLQEHNRVNLAMRESEEKYRKLFEGESDSLLIVDAQTLAIEEVNRATLDTFGYTDEVLKEMKFVDIFDGTDQMKDEVIQGVADRTEAASYLLKKKDNSLFSGEISSRIFNAAGHRKIIVAIRDISERMTLEDRLVQSHKMESIGTLAGGIAHDFNNILSVILGYAELAQSDVPQDSSIAKDLDEVLKASHRAKELVQQILAFSRQSSAERVLVQPSTIVKEAVKMLHHSLPSTIAIKEDIAAQNEMILANPTEIHQIVMNLCTNAFHAMEATGGVLQVSVKKRLIKEGELRHESGDLKTGDYIEISVSDNGEGIEPTVLNKIFDPYFTTKVAHKGTGMGLSIIHGIVAAYDGVVTVDSILGEGTTFHVFIPIARQNKLETIPHSVLATPLPSGTERILLVEDEESLAKMNCKILERMGYKVTVTQNGLEALELFKRDPDRFDLVLTDQTMPKMTGAELTQRLLQICPQMPIILYSGYSSIISKKEAMALGAKDFVIKPLVTSEIASVIRKALT